VAKDRSETPFDLIIGYHNNSLYVGVSTLLDDQYYSRISLLIDGGGNGIWGDAMQNSTEDIRVTAASPRGNEDYNGIFTHSGQKIQPLGLVYDSGVTESGVSAEFLIPISTVSGNTTVGIGLGLIVSQGGFDSYLPIIFLSEGNLLIVRNSGPRVGSPISVLILATTMIVASVAITIQIIFRPKNPTAQITVTHPNEELERIRTLIYSHPEITIERLTLLTNSDRASISKAIDVLREDGMLLSSTLVSETNVIRAVSPSEKKQK
jgi:hypothetical protein